MFNAVSRSERNLSSLEVTDLTDAPKSHFLEPSQRIYPTGKSAKILSIPFRKNISVFPKGKSGLELSLSRARKRGVSRSSRTLGAGCNGRSGLRRASADE
jgi:hypothetical protein